MYFFIYSSVVSIKAGINKYLSYLSSMRNIFFDILTQAPLPEMLLGPMAKGSGKPKWNHFPVQLFGNEQISGKNETLYGNSQERLWFSNAQTTFVHLHCLFRIFFLFIFNELKIKLLPKMHFGSKLYWTKSKL